MNSTRIAVFLTIALLAVSVLLIASFAYSPQAASQIQLQSSIVGSTPDTPIDGIASGGAPWVVTAGEAGLAPNGMINVNMVGLLISAGPFDGTTGPVTEVLASLVCQGTGIVAASTDAVPLAPNGNAHINQMVTLPSTCAGPIILIRIYATTSGVLPSQPWIAATGFAG